MVIKETSLSHNPFAAADGVPMQAFVSRVAAGDRDSVFSARGGEMDDVGGRKIFAE